jgi:hypothetical protein
LYKKTLLKNSRNTKSQKQPIYQIAAHINHRDQIYENRIAQKEKLQEMMYWER